MKKIHKQVYETVQLNDIFQNNLNTRAFIVVLEG